MWGCAGMKICILSTFPAYGKVRVNQALKGGGGRGAGGVRERVQKILRESQALSWRHWHWFWNLTEKSSFGKCLTTRRRLTEIASLVYLTSLFYCLINQSEFAIASVRRGEQNGVIIAGVPFLHSPIPSPFFPRQEKTRQCFIWSLIQSYVHRLYPNNLKS